MKKSYAIYPVGVIHTGKNASSIEIFKEYQDAILGLEGFSHIIILCWFHENDIAERRKTLKVHPRGDKGNPLTGVFATRSPVRPNLISHFMSRIISLDGNRINIERINALEGSPVIDIKPYIPHQDSLPEVIMPDWLKKR